MVVGLLVMAPWVRPATATDRQVFERLIEKVAPAIEEIVPGKLKPKVACACPIAFGGQPGFVVRYRGAVRCNYPVFDETGQLLANNVCDNFAVLGR